MPTKVRTLSIVSMVVTNRPISTTVPSVSPAWMKSPTLKGRSTIRKAPAAKFESRPDQAMPMATPAAASTAAKVVVSTPDTPRMATMSTMLSSTPADESAYFSSVSSTERDASRPRMPRCTSEMSMRPTIHRAMAPSSLRPMSYAMPTRGSSQVCRSCIGGSVSGDPMRTRPGRGCPFRRPYISSPTPAASTPMSPSPAMPPAPMAPA